MTARFSARARFALAAVVCCSSSLASAQDAGSPVGDASAAVSADAAAGAVNAQLSPSNTPLRSPTPAVFTPPACTVEELESLSQSAWWEGLSTACASLNPLGLRPLDPPTEESARVWHSFVGQCRSGQGRSARLLCDVPESTRATALSSFSDYVRVLTRRVTTAQSYCLRIEALRGSVSQQPETARPALIDAISQLQSFCSTPNAPLLTPAALAALAGPAGGRDGAQGGRGEGASGGIGAADRGTSESAMLGSRQSAGGLPTPAGMLDLARRHRPRKPCLV